MIGEQNLFEYIRTRDVIQVNNLLRKRTIKINCKDESFPSQPTPLLVAAEFDCLPIVENLLKYRADVDMHDKFGKRPIWWAVKHENLEMVELLIGHQCFLNYLDKETGYTPLHFAIIKNNTRLANLLIYGGADVNLKKMGIDAVGNTPLITAIQQGNMDIVKLLFNCRADINAKAKDGLTALHYAVTNRRYNIVEALLQARCKMYSESVRGVTPMTLAIEDDVPYMVRLLLEFGYDGNKPFLRTITPLQHAISCVSSKCAFTLIANGVSILPPRTNSNYSYFRVAVERNMLEVARLLLLLLPSNAQERWVRQRHYPQSISQNTDFKFLLEKHSTNPYSLQELCRSTLFRSLGRFPLDRLPKLANRLPLPLVRYCSYPEAIDTTKLYSKVAPDTPQQHHKSWPHDEPEGACVVQPSASKEHSVSPKSVSSLENCADTGSPRRGGGSNC